METPSVPRRDRFRQIARAGADIILGHHPHVPQGIEIVDGCLIAYSLGNFVFDSHTSGYQKNNSIHTAHTYLLLVRVNEEGVQGFERIPMVIDPPPEQRPAPAEGVRAESLQSYFEYLDQAVQDDETVYENWTKKAREFLLRYARGMADVSSADELIYNTVSRLLFVAENRSVMDWVYRLAEERWQAFVAGENRYQRPLYRLQKK
jgi:hypothetical protein